MKNGYRVIDTDTHVGRPRDAGAVRRAGAAFAVGRVGGLPSPITDGGHQLSISPYPYRRKIRESTVIDDSARVPGRPRR